MLCHAHVCPIQNLWIVIKDTGMQTPEALNQLRLACTAAYISELTCVTMTMHELSVSTLTAASTRVLQQRSLNMNPIAKHVVSLSDEMTA